MSILTIKDLGEGEEFDFEQGEDSEEEVSEEDDW